MPSLPLAKARQGGRMLEDVKRQVHRVLETFPESGLVAGSSGNASARSGDYVVIKPSGVSYAELSPLDLVVLTLDGRVVEGTLRPSVDADTHLAIYRHLDHVGGIVHTHSTYATSFALLGASLPVFLTEMADMLGAEVPITDYAPVGGEEIGLEVVRKIGACKAVLVRRHGVFTVGASAAEALKVAVLLEHSAHVVHVAMLRGDPQPMSDDEVQRCYRRYHDAYGQR